MDLSEFAQFTGSDGEIYNIPINEVRVIKDVKHNNTILSLQCIKVLNKSTIMYLYDQYPTSMCNDNSIAHAGLTSLVSENPDIVLDMATPGAILLNIAFNKKPELILKYINTANRRWVVAALRHGFDFMDAINKSKCCQSRDGIPLDFVKFHSNSFAVKLILGFGKYPVNILARMTCNESFMKFIRQTPSVGSGFSYPDGVFEKLLELRSKVGIK